MEPYTELRVPKIFNLRTDPYERADITSNTYFDWMLDHAWTLIPAQAYVAQMAQSLVEFPPSQTPSQFHDQPGHGQAPSRNDQRLTSGRVQDSSQNGRGTAWLKLGTHREAG